MNKLILLAVASVGMMSHPQGLSAGSAADVGFHGDLIRFQMLDATTGWAEGKSKNAAFLLSTRDGGLTWSDITPRQVQSAGPLLWSDAQSAIAFRLLDGEHGWVICSQDTGDHLFDQTLSVTEDGGKHWRKSAFHSTVGTAVSIQYPDREHGYILVESDAASGHSHKAVYCTADGGAMWKAAAGDLPSTGFTEAMVFRNATDGWVTGSPRGEQDAFFFQTRDGAKTWQPQKLPPPDEVNRGYAKVQPPQFFGQEKAAGLMSVLFVQHDPNRSEIAVYRTEDGGEHWQHQGKPPTGADDIQQAGADVRRAFLLADDELFTTEDQGKAWTRVATTLSLNDKVSIAQIDFVSPTKGWGLERILGNDYTSELLQTNDGGHTWTHCFGGGAARPTR